MLFQSLLFVILSSLLTIDAQIKSQDVERGTLVRLMCRPKSDRTDIPTTYEWFDPRNISRGSNIHFEIPNFTEANVGVYTCRANQILDGQVATTQVSILVRLKDSVDVEVPESISNTSRTRRSSILVRLKDSDDVEVLESYSSFICGIIFLPCKVKSKDESGVKYEWITPTGEIHAISSFFQNHATKSHAGMYTCRATVNNQVFEGRSFVYINELPIKVETVSGTMKFGETIELRCQVDTSQTDKKVFARFTYTWLDPRNQIISINQNVLIKLDDMTKFDTYQCRITAPAMTPPYSQMQSMEIIFSGSTNPEVQTSATTTMRITTTTKDGNKCAFSVLLLLATYLFNTIFCF